MCNCVCVCLCVCLFATGGQPICCSEAAASPVSISAKGQRFCAQPLTQKRRPNSTAMHVNLGCSPPFLLLLAISLLPPSAQEWERGIKDDKMMTPREDVKSPDLYIPTMALVTYILLVSYIMGMNGLFNAEQLSVLCSSTLGVLVFEVRERVSE